MEDISVQILSQTSENIQKLFDLTTRIDERVKSIQSKQEDFDDRLNDVVRTHTELMQKIAVLESKNVISNISELGSKIDECYKEMVVLDKRITSVEKLSDNHQNKWNDIRTFIVQLIWIILAAWLLMKMNLNPPPVP